MKKERTVGILAPCADVLQRKLSRKGYTLLDYSQADYADVFEALPGMEGIVVSTRFSLDTTFLKEASSLKWVARLGSGLDHIDVEFAHQQGITILSSPEGNAPSVAEHCLGMLLSALRHIASSATDVKSFAWRRQHYRGNMLSSLKVGIVGYGHTGSAFFRLLHSLGVAVVSYDKYKLLSSLSKNQRASTLTQLQQTCNVISLHLPLNQETYYYASKAFFQRMVRHPILINTSRGTIVHTQELLQALERRQISYACLDVLENEKLDSMTREDVAVFNQVVKHPQILVTPHIGGVTKESFESMSAILADKILSLS